MEGAEYGKTRYLRGLCRFRPSFYLWLLLSHLFFADRLQRCTCTPRGGRDPLEEMFGVRMVDHESLFFVFIETFGSCDSQLDCLLRCAVLTPFPPYSASVAGVSSAVLRACCASVHSFLVWTYGAQSEIVTGLRAEMKRLSDDIKHYNESDPQALREFFESNMAAEANILNRIVPKRKGTPGPLYPVELFIAALRRCVPFDLRGFLDVSIVFNNNTREIFRGSMLM
ncbi:hypothetical protein PAPYR_9801 [Paratrimastix pyriformis]|uniref:Uncharacterized protein n=1 Tax=Paratrimastix pyriformis TaxID=342808 RepID=A0ABQ8UBI6_9EUKA|nr:hypothetical protein PAPYR_9801 [Paratrimastix pyriformis]